MLKMPIMEWNTTKTLFPFKLTELELVFPKSTVRF